MGKNIYNENVYLSNDKEAMDTFLRKKEEYQLLYALERLQHEEVLKLYNKYLLLVRDLLKSFSFNSSLEYSIALAYLIHKGYLSFNKEFKSKEIQDEIHSRYGTTIIRGYGCCRNFSDMTRDMLMLLNYYVKNLYCYLPNLSLPKSAIYKQANHVINVIEYDGVKYGIDLLNSCALYRFKNPLTLERISSFDNDKIRNKPYFEIITGDSSLDEIKEELKDFNAERKKRTISPLEYEDEIKPETIIYMNEHKSILDEFHNDTNQIKEGIALKLKSNLTKQN